MLLCQSILLGAGVDKILDLIAVLDPKQTGDDSTNIWTWGTSVMQWNEKTFYKNIRFIPVNILLTSWDM